MHQEPGNKKTVRIRDGQLFRGDFDSEFQLRASSGYPLKAPWCLLTRLPDLGISLGHS